MLSDDELKRFEPFEPTLGDVLAAIGEVMLIGCTCDVDIAFGRDRVTGAETVFYAHDDDCPGHRRFVARTN